MSSIQPVQSNPTPAAAPIRPPTATPAREVNETASSERQEANSGTQEPGETSSVGGNFNALA